jgi:peptidoglycan/LPS O-acetylase OafA/YrhL
LQFLDFARGVAALLVVLAHGLSISVPGFLDWSRRNLDLGRAGVVLFLMISGFIIPASLEQGGHLGKFWLRRLFRLFPAYWLSVAAAFAYLALGGTHPLAIRLDDTPSWLANLTMCQGFLRRPDAWGVYWTLQLELIIYATCSLLFAVGLLRRVGWWVGAAVVLAFLPVGLFRPLFMGKTYVLGDVRLLYFAPLVGLVAQRYWSGRLGRGRFYLFLAAQPVALAAVWSVSKALDPEGIELANLWTVLCNWGSAYALFLVLLEGRLRLPAAGVWLGRVSYSAYLFHPLALWLLMTWKCPAPAFVPALVVMTLLLSAAAYHGVEAPGIALGRLVEARLFARRDVPAVVRPSRRPDSERRSWQGSFAPICTTPAAGPR